MKKIWQLVRKSKRLGDITNKILGTPLNIWQCECGHLESIGSIKELVEKAVEDIDETIELHRPYVDDIHLKCPKCDKLMSG